MSLPASRARTVFRACVVNAIREGESLMQQLAGAAQVALAEQESASRDYHQRNLAADALRELTRREPELVRAYPLALLEAFADGPAQARAPVAAAAQDSGIDFGDLALVEEDDVLAQVELARAQQVAEHATEAALAELNALVSSAQGLPSVQPERNPLRPDNYIRALQQVIAAQGVAASVRQLWMTHMRDLLGRQLVDVYQRAARELREHGVQPVGYAVAGVAGAARIAAGAHYGASGYMGEDAPHPQHSMSGALAGHYGAHAAGASSVWGATSAGAPLNAQAQEALLTVGMLQQMLAGGGDPYGWPAQALDHGASAPLPAHAAEALDDLAQLEQLVGRLAAGGVPTSGAWSEPAPAQSARPGAPAADDGAPGVVTRMMDNIARDARLLPPVQRAMQELAPALRQLVRHDTAFFSDEQHPARRLLDELTQRSLAFDSEGAAGFSRFMRLVDEAVLYLAGASIESAKPFARVMRALEKAWETQERQLRERREARQREQQLRERCALLAERVAAQLRRLPEAQGATPDALAFVTGPWAQIVARAQASDDPEAANGYLALAPLLLGLDRPPPTGADLRAAAQAIAQALTLVERGLDHIDHPQQARVAFVGRLEQWQAQLLELAQQGPAAGETPPAMQELQEAEEESAPSPAAGDDDTAMTAPQPEALPKEISQASAPAPAAPAPPPEPARQGEAGEPQEQGLRLALGLWFEIAGEQASVLRQLTWASPNATLFLFTGSDGSSQSMTRRMIDRLAAQGRFRALPDA